MPRIVFSSENTDAHTSIIVYGLSPTEAAIKLADLPDNPMFAAPETEQYFEECLRSVVAASTKVPFEAEILIFLSNWVATEQDKGHITGSPVTQFYVGLVGKGATELIIGERQPHVPIVTADFVKDKDVTKEFFTAITTSNDPHKGH